MNVIKLMLVLILIPMGLWICLASFSGKFSANTFSEFLTETLVRTLALGLGMVMVWLGYLITTI